MTLLLTGAFPWTEEQIIALKNLGFQILMVEREDQPLTDTEKSADVVVCNWLFVYNKIEEFKHLKCVHLLSAGLERIPLDYVREHNIQLWNARGVYSVPIAEFVLCGVLQILKASRFFMNNQIHATWEKNRKLLELYDQNVLIIGTGSVGTEVAKRFQAFTNHVHGIDLKKFDIPYFEKIALMDNLDEELIIADIVVVTLPLTDETYHLFNKSRFWAMKDQSIFVNVARGGLADERALLEALQNGKLHGAVLDVFEKEPLPEDSALWKQENVIVTPHNSFVGNGNNDRMWNLIYNHLKDFCAE